MSSSLSHDDFMLLDSVQTQVKRKRRAVYEINYKREEFREYHHLFSDPKRDKARFFEYTKMTLETFNYILKKVEHRLVKIWCNWHKQPIQPEERLVITIR